MPKTSIQKRFDNSVSKDLRPQSKAKGYRKTGNNFRFYSFDGWGKIVNIQKSTWHVKDDIRFTTNTGLYLPETDTIFEAPRSEKFPELDCLVRKRIGNLDELQGDLLYDLYESTIFSDLKGTISHDFSQFILSYLERIQSRDNILRQTIQEHKPNEKVTIQTLFICGYQEAARPWIEEEISKTIYRTWRERLVKPRSSLA